MQFEKMTRETFIWQKYLDIYAAYRIQMINNRVFKIIKEYLFELLVELTVLKPLIASTGLNDECKLFFFCQGRMQAQLLI